MNEQTKPEADWCAVSRYLGQIANINNGPDRGSAESRAELAAELAAKAIQHLPARHTARAAILEAMRAVLPVGIPLSFERILEARFEGRGKSRRAVAEVIMFDGKAARLAVHKWADAPDAWAHQWLVMEGGDIYWNGERWTRVES